MLFGVISFEASIKLLKMFPVHTSIKSPPEGTLGFTPIHTQREKIYTMVRAYKAAKKKKKYSFYERVGVHGGKEREKGQRQSRRLYTSCVPLPPSLASEILSKRSLVPPSHNSALTYSSRGVLTVENCPR